MPFLNKIYDTRIGNINLHIIEADLGRLLPHLGKISTVQPVRDKWLLFSRPGFCNYASGKAEQSAILTLRGTVLAGKVIRVTVL